MSRRYENTEAIAKALIRSMVKDGSYSAKTIAHAKEHLQILIGKYLGDRSLYDYTPEDVKQFVNNLSNSGLAISTQKSYFHTLKSLLRFIGNQSSETKVTFQADIRPCVDWLTPDEAQIVLNTPLPCNERLAIILALCMGLRKVEIIRLRLQDIDHSKQCVNVIGKGRAGGKLRLVPFHARFIPALEEYNQYRAGLIQKAKGETPDNLLVWFDRSNKRVMPYNSVKASGMDCLIRRASVTCGVHFSAHTLRRTFGRLMWLSGVPVVVIARILGHSSTEQTLEYIGANLDDMAGAMRVFSLQ